MKLQLSTRERGTALMIVIVLLAVMFALVMAGTHSLIHLKSELKQVERDQTNRLARTPISARSP